MKYIGDFSSKEPEPNSNKLKTIVNSSHESCFGSNREIIILKKFKVPQEESDELTEKSITSMHYIDYRYYYYGTLIIFGNTPYVNLVENMIDYWFIDQGIKFWARVVSSCARLSGHALD